MTDFLDILGRDAQETIDEGHYLDATENVAKSISLRKAISLCRCAPIITEIKSASPSSGVIRENVQADKIAESMAKGGSVAISVLTEPKHFSGSLSNLSKVRKAVDLPILMKDIIISPVQLDAASRVGANAVLLIQALCDRGYWLLDAQRMIGEAHSRGLEVLLEVHNEKEFQRAIKSDADFVGINNRNLADLKVDLNVTKKILERKLQDDKITVSESGISTADDVRFLRTCGAKAFLVGSAIMSACDAESKVRELAQALRDEAIE